MTTTTTATTLAEIKAWDTETAELVNELAKANHTFEHAKWSLYRIAKVDPKRSRISLKEVRDIAATQPDARDYSLGKSGAEVVANFDAWQNLVDEMITRIDEREAIVTWPRFFLVRNDGGHIHSSTRCSTCRWSTQFAWLPALSGDTEADAVAAHGAILCTVCYPSAPVEHTGGISHATRDEKAARAAERAASAAAKAAKAARNDLVAHDGLPMVSDDTSTSSWGDVTKVTQARESLSSWVVYGHKRARFAHAPRVLAALATKMGTTPTGIMAKYAKTPVRNGYVTQAEVDALVAAADAIIAAHEN